MGRYFPHLRDGTDETIDAETVEMPVEAIAGVALRSARDCIAGEVMKGKSPPRLSH
jgi:hypothetical protein